MTTEDKGTGQQAQAGPEEKPAEKNEEKTEKKAGVSPDAGASRKQEEAPAVKVPAAEAPDSGKKPETGPSAGPAEGKDAVRKKKKINLMSVKEIDARLKTVEEKMGNLRSRYAKQLLKQKDVLNKPII
jgi:hypothetical protein